MQQKIFQYLKKILDLVISGQWKVILFIALILLGGCDRTREQKPEKQMDKIILGVGSGLFLSPIWVAENKGYFQEEGLDVTLKAFGTGKESFEAMLEGAVDISTVAPTPIVFSSFLRQDFLVFATFSSSDTNIKLIARKDSGINTVKDLKGKRIGTPLGTSAHFFLSSYMVYHGIRESEIVMVDTRPPDLVAALDNSQVDAIVIWEPFAHKARQLLQHNAVMLPIPKIFKETFNLTVMDGYAGNHPEVLKKILRALGKATTFISNYKKESIGIVSQRMELDKEDISILWDGYRFEVGLEQSLIITLENEARWAIENKLTDGRQVPNYLDYISIKALDEVEPQAVTIIR